MKGHQKLGLLAAADRSVAGAGACGLPEGHPEAAGGRLPDVQSDPGPGQHLCPGALEGQLTKHLQHLWPPMT